MRVTLISTKLLRGGLACSKPWNTGSFLDPTVVTGIKNNFSRRCLQRFVSTSNSARQRGSYRPKLKHYTMNENVYVLTLLTDVDHNDSMNSLREAYFPPQLNKIPAHITLFHALPETKLSDKILPAIRKVASRTPRYWIRATRPFRLSKGIGIGVEDGINHTAEGSSNQARGMTGSIHAELRREWSDWLSEQDSRPVKLHYTVMNKVFDPSVVEKAFEELKEIFEQSSTIQRERQPGGDHFPTGNRIIEGSDQDASVQNLRLAGEVHGLTLWLYRRTGHWSDPKHFRFEESRS